MNRLFLASTAFLLPLIVSGCGPPKASMTESQIAATIQEVLSASLQMRESSSRGDWETMASFYSDSPQFRFYGDGGLQYASAQDIRTALSALPPGTTIEEFTDTEVDVLSPEHVVVGTLYQTEYSDSTGSSFEWGGALSIVWVREENGWRILSGHSSARQSQAQY